VGDGVGENLIEPKVCLHSAMIRPGSVVSLKFIGRQTQILRLTTPELKDVRGPFAQDDSFASVAYFEPRTSAIGLS